MATETAPQHMTIKLPRSILGRVAIWNGTNEGGESIGRPVVLLGSHGDKDILGLTINQESSVNGAEPEVRYGMPGNFKPDELSSLTGERLSPDEVKAAYLSVMPASIAATMKPQVEQEINRYQDEQRSLASRIIRQMLVIGTAPGQ